MRSKKSIKIDHNREVGWAYFIYASLYFQLKYIYDKLVSTYLLKLSTLLPTLEQQDSTKLPRYYFVTRRERRVYSEATKIHSFVRLSQMLFIPLSGVNMRRIFSQFWFHEINPIWTSLRLWALAHKSYYNLASRIELIIWNLSTYNNKAEISLLGCGQAKGK